jgi:hypothetical protein
VCRAHPSSVSASAFAVETNFLTEFHKRASPIEARMQTHRSWFPQADGRLEDIKERLSKLEKRQN